MEEDKRSGTGRKPGLLSRYEAVVFIFYAAVVALMTWPAATLTSRTYAQKGDPMGALWILWWLRYSAAHHLQANPMNMVGVPNGYPLNIYSGEVLSTGSLKAMSLATTETIAYNVFLLVFFFFAAVSMYYFARWLTGSQAAAAVAGFIFAFSPYMLMQGKEHPALITVAWMPLFFYLLIRAVRERSVLLGVLCAVSFAVLALFNYHLGLIAAFMAMVFLVTAWLLTRPWRRLPEGFARKAVPLAVLGVVVVAVAVLVIVRKPTDLTGSYLYSARPWEYFIPHAEGLLFGWMTSGFITSHLHGGFLSESSLFLGFVPMILVVYALVSLVRGQPRKRPESEGTDQADGEKTDPGEGAGMLACNRRLLLALAVAGAACFLMSMPPSTNILGFKIYLPSYLMHLVAPPVRAWARFGVGVYFAVAVLAGYGLAVLLKRVRWTRAARLGAVAVISLLVLLEFAIIPPFHSLSTASTTDYYTWLKGHPAGTVVAMYPFFYTDDFDNYAYFFDQRHHEKKMANGVQPDTGAEDTRQLVLDLTNPSTPGILKRLGVDYVLAIPSLYREGNHVNYVDPITFDAGAVAPTLEQVRKFDDCYVFRNTARPARIVSSFISGAYQSVLTKEGKTWHTGGGNVTVNIRSYAEAPLTCDVRFQAVAPRKAGNIRVSLNGRDSGQGDLPSWPSEFIIRNVTIAPGSNLLNIQSDAPKAPVPQVPGATTVDVRVLVSDITVTPR